MKNDSTKTFITCPHCGAQYLAEEIYMPDQLLGKVQQIIKDPLGKILYNDWKPEGEPEFKEHFECESCGKPFVVEATLTFKTKAEDEELDFTESSVSLLDD